MLFWGWSVEGVCRGSPWTALYGSPRTWSVVGLRGPGVSVFGLPGISVRGIVEYKCPFKGGYPSHYKQLPACYQMQLNMKATNADWCHFVTWTPQTTRVYTVVKNDSFITELLDVVHEHFWNLTAPPTSLHPKLKEIERKAKENSEKIKMVVEIQSYIRYPLSLTFQLSVLKTLTFRSQKERVINH